MAAEAPPPVSIRLIWRLRDLLEQYRGGLLGAALVFLLAFVLGRGFYMVENGESGALLRLGALIDDAVPPGLHYRLPLGIDEIVERRTGEVIRMQIAGYWEPWLSLVSGDENLLDVVAVVQYRILSLGDFLFTADNAALVVHQTVRAELLEEATTLPVDELLTAAKAQVQQRVQQRGQQRLDAYGLGVALVSVSLQSVDPPREAAKAFRAVLDARADAGRGISLAQSRADRRLGLARGRAVQLLTEAEAAADRRRQQARAAARRFDDLLTQKRRSPELTRTELYARTVRDVLSRTQLILLPPGETDHIDLQLLDPER